WCRGPGPNQARNLIVSLKDAVVPKPLIDGEQRFARLCRWNLAPIGISGMPLLVEGSKSFVIPWQPEMKLLNVRRGIACDSTGRFQTCTLVVPRPPHRVQPSVVDEQTAESRSVAHVLHRPANVIEIRLPRVLIPPGRFVSGHAFAGQVA